MSGVVKNASTDYGFRFSVLLERRTGIRLSPTIMSRIRGVLTARADTLAFPSVDAYLAHLDQGEAASELQKLTNLITVGKTSFNRYPDQIRAVVQTVVPALDALLHPAQSINVWSAGCSTGEEPYTIAMALAASGWFDKRRFRILATDINTNSLEHAKTARYYLPHAERLPDFVRSGLVADGDHFVVQQALRDRVSFSQLNLYETAYPDAGSWHVVLCCNVLIYFSPQNTVRVVQRFASALANDGLFMLGGAETLSSLPTDLKLARFGETYGYLHGTWGSRLDGNVIQAVRGDGAAKRDTQAATSAPIPSSPREPTTARLPATSSTPSVQVQPGAVGTPRSATPSTPPVSPLAGDGGAAAQLERGIEEAMRLATNGQRKGAIERLLALRETAPDHPRLPRLAGLLLFNERRFPEAIEVLNDAVVQDPLAFDLYFYLGWMHLSLAHLAEAQEDLRRALFLEPGFAFARYEFALALHRQGDFDAAQREYARAEQVARDPRLRERLRERAEGAGESFWVDDSFIAELCRNNRDRARLRQEPVSIARPGDSGQAGPSPVASASGRKA